MRMYKKHVIWLASVGVLCALVAGFWWMGIRQRERARAFLKDLASLQLGTSTFSDAQQLARKYGGKPYNGPAREPTCSVDDCDLSFLFENALKNRQGERTLSLDAGLTVKNGKVVRKQIDLTLMTTTWATQFLYTLVDSVSLADPRGYHVTISKVQAHGIPHVLEVRLGPTAPAAVRKSAYSINLSCLTLWHRCDGPNDFIPPGLWSQ